MTDDPDNARPSKKVAPAADSAVLRASDAPNPQGKGLVGFLQDWDYSSPRGIVVKRKAQVLADYFTSLLVLSASFKFKPVFNKDYYLYFDNPSWKLSLIAPDDWQSAAKRAAFVGTCVLHDDSTWSIDPSENLSKRGPIADAVAEFYDRFVEKLHSENPLEAGLPFYEGSLPYWQRLFAAALSRSLRGSLTRGGQLQIASREWLARAPGDAIEAFALPGSDTPK